MPRRFHDSARIPAAFALGVALALPVPALAQPVARAGGEVTLAGHRAVYDLQLAQSRGKQALESVRGRILYDFSGSRCEGYALNFRQVTELQPGEGKPGVMSDLRSTNWEDGTGRRFTFTTQNFINGEEIDAAQGSAQREGGSAAVKIEKPEAKAIDLGDVIFPSAHMKRIIATAIDGRTVLEIATFDGSEKGEKVYNSLAVIGQPIAPGSAPPPDSAAGQKALEPLRRWPVTISYFDRAKASGEQTPSYAISFELYENGIARGVRLDYGDFVLEGTLTSLEIKKAAPCP